jgi:predicted DNA-binding transcriptional regulator YafY
VRRADRLFNIVQFLRSRRVTTAAWLAAKLGVSVRTIYRDIEDLVLSGVPVEGEPGVGYAIRRGMSLPPLQFDASELTALMVGLRFVQSFTTPQLATAASTAFAKIRSVSAPGVIEPLERQKIVIPATATAPGDRLQTVSAAIGRREKLAIDYVRESEASSRILRPLAISFTSHGWSFTGWCELRDDFRTFRFDRIRSLAATGERFVDEPGKTFEDYARQMEERHGLRPGSLDPDLA